MKFNKLIGIHNGIEFFIRVQLISKDLEALSTAFFVLCVVGRLVYRQQHLLA